jgi:hypothetical protein
VAGDREREEGKSAADLEAKTLFPSWRVKDILAHLLDTSIRRLSSQRDGYRSLESPRIESYGDLLRYIEELADRWALAFEGVSPRILAQMIGRYQDELADFFRTIDPEAEAPISVAWAGEAKSANWFDIAREYTERWQHQMQIRDVLGAEPIYEVRLYHPVLEAFMRAMPHHFRDLRREDGCLLTVDVVGAAGGRWCLEWRGGAPALAKEGGRKPDALVTMDEDTAWRRFTKWGEPRESRIEGDLELGRRLLGMTCVMIS